jgi:thioesterase domain-containing protein
MSMPVAALIPMRKGFGDRPVFMFSGAGGDVQELAAVAAALGGSRAIVGVEPFTPGDDGLPPATVEAMAAQTFAALRERQPEGPYDLIGYSFGGLVALETAQLLRDAGQAVGPVVLIDALYDRRFWPVSVFMASQAKRSAVHLASLSRLSFAEAAPEFAERARRLFGRVALRGAPPAIDAAQEVPSIEARCIRAMTIHRPRRYDGPVTLFRSASDEEFGCDLQTLWRPLIRQLRVSGIEGNHLGLVREAASVSQLAQGLDQVLDEAERGAAAA